MRSAAAWLARQNPAQFLVSALPWTSFCESLDCEPAFFRNVE